MMKFNEANALAAIRDAVHETVSELGISFVRKLSFSPSVCLDRKLQEKEAA
jgi:hypothetical protein